jgi:hypothetical protein
MVANFIREASGILDVTMQELCPMRDKQVVAIRRLQSVRRLGS